MSRIFDALRRSESEQSGDNTELLPESQELLRRTERRIASRWEAKAPAHENEAENGIDGYQLSGPESARVDGAVEPVSDGSWTAEERLAFLNKIQSQPISLEPGSRLVCLTDRESPTAEAMRLLTVRLRDLRRIKPLKKVLVTSTIPREGKSTISANLACALARGNEEKTLLIEGDVRLPTLRQMFGIEVVPGISELIEDGRDASECVHYLDEAGVWVLPTGRIPRNPLEVLQSERLPEVMDHLAECFDWIVIDSPPVLPLADTSIWMRLVDGILLVARQGTTEKQQLQRGLEALVPQKVIGALLNCSVASAYSDYYYRTPSSSER